MQVIGKLKGGFIISAHIILTYEYIYEYKYILRITHTYHNIWYKKYKLYTKRSY